jgi:hypothetical protein
MSFFKKVVSIVKATAKAANSEIVKQYDIDIAKKVDVMVDKVADATASARNAVANGLNKVADTIEGSPLDVSDRRKRNNKKPIEVKLPNKTKGGKK